MIKYMKRGTKGEIALALTDGLAYNEDLEKVMPWVGYDPVAGKMYCDAKDGNEAFPVTYRIKAECGDEPVESRGGAKAKQYYYTYMEIGAFGDWEEAGTVIDLDLPSCTYNERSGYYDIATIDSLVIHDMDCDIYTDNGEGGYAEFDDGFYFSNPVRNLKLTLTEIPQNAEPERGMTKSPEPEPVYGWVLTFEEYNPR